MGVLACYSIVSPQMPLRVTSEVPYAVGMVGAQSMMSAVNDAFVTEFRDIEHYFGRKFGIRIPNGCDR